MYSIAIIPARGGSKRLPRKNCKNFLGHPLFLWTCFAAKKSNCFDRIVVSSDDLEICTIAQEHGFEIDMRPPELATDEASTTQVCLELLERIAKQGEHYDSVALLYPTAPLRTAEDIRNMMQLLEDENTDFVHAVSSYEGNPYQLMFLGQNGYLTPAWPLFVNKKSQELPEPLRGNGSSYFAKTTALLREKCFYGPRLKGYRMERCRSIDIDTQEDFNMLLASAEMLKEETHA